MKRNLKLMVTGLVLLTSLVNCTESGGDKPAFNPTEGMVADGKQDFASNALTTVRGEIQVDQKKQDQIDYTAWLHGYTLTIDQSRVGQTINLGVAASERGYFLVYGPSTKRQGDRYLFGQPLFLGMTKKDQGFQWSSFDLKVKEAGVYMIVYGPRFAWSADYTFRTECTENCEVKDLPNGAVCESDEQCGDGFCACEDWDCPVRKCRAFTGEGEHCGGFVPQHLVSRCAPGLVCAGGYLAADMPGRCALEASVAKIQSNPASYEGHLVSLVANLTVAPPMCTLMMCAPNECCNSCGAQMLLSDETSGAFSGLSLRSHDGASYSCGGNNCNYQQNCTKTPGRYNVIGTISTEDGVSTITVNEISPVLF